MDSLKSYKGYKVNDSISYLGEKAVIRSMNKGIYRDDVMFNLLVYSDNGTRRVVRQVLAFRDGKKTDLIKRIITF